MFLLSHDDAALTIVVKSHCYMMFLLVTRGIYILCSCNRLSYLYLVPFSISLYLYFYLFDPYSYFCYAAVAIDRAGNAFTVGYDGSSSSVYYSSLSSAYATWTSVSVPGK
jgi:hypothetical protein